MKLYSLSFAVSLVVAILSSACGPDHRDVYYISDGGMGGTDQGNDCDDCSENGGTANEEPDWPSGLPGVGMKDRLQIFSFDIRASDAYNEWPFAQEKVAKLISCAESTTCMQAAKANSSGREFQYLGTGSYSESYPGTLKGYGLYRTGTCGGKIEIRSAADRVAWGWGKLSQSTTSPNEFSMGPNAHIIFEPDYWSDECTPFAAVILSEHSVNITQ